MLFLLQQPEWTEAHNVHLKKYFVYVHVRTAGEEMELSSGLMSFCPKILVFIIFLLYDENFKKYIK